MPFGVRIVYPSRVKVLRMAMAAAMGFGLWLPTAHAERAQLYDGVIPKVQDDRCPRRGGRPRDSSSPVIVTWVGYQHTGDGRLFLQMTGKAEPEIGPGKSIFIPSSVARLGNHYRRLDLRYFDGLAVKRSSLVKRGDGLLWQFETKSTFSPTWSWVRSGNYWYLVVPASPSSSK